MRYRRTVLLLSKRLRLRSDRIQAVRFSGDNASKALTRSESIGSRESADVAREQLLKVERVRIVVMVANTTASKQSA